MQLTGIQCTRLHCVIYSIRRNIILQLISLDCWCREQVPFTVGHISLLRTHMHKKMVKPEVVFVLGGPGCGKGTQCKKIVEKFGYVHLSAGDLLRAERSKDSSKFKDLIETHIKNGTIVPVEITCSLLEQAMEESEKNKFLIDGFPRNENNLSGWNLQMSDKTDVKSVLVFECPQEVCVQRCLERGAAGSGRSDDNLESLKKRFETFLNETVPVIKYYENLQLVTYVDATRNPDKVFEDVSKLFSSF